MSHRNKWFICCIICICVLFTAGPGLTQDKDQTPNPLIRFYQQHISSIDGDRCPMYPSCSHYASKAFSTHGPVIGWIMTCDRLVRCGRDETRLTPQVQRQGRVFSVDPVSANDFWWFQKNNKKKDTK